MTTAVISGSDRRRGNNNKSDKSTANRRINRGDVDVVQRSQRRREELQKHMIEASIREKTSTASHETPGAVGLLDRYLSTLQFPPQPSTFPCSIDNFRTVAYLHL